MHPHIAIIHVEDFEAEPFEEIAIRLRHEGLKVQRHQVPRPGPVAALEWLVPTAIVVYIFQPYFKSFLAEAGKDHYNLLKRGVTSLAKRFTGDRAPQPVLVSSKGKVSSETQKYSLLYSIVVELEGKTSVKLLLQADITSEDAEQAVGAFLDFVHKFHNGNFDPSSISGFIDAKPRSNTLLVAYNSEGQRLEVVDPFPKHIRDKMN